MNCVLRRTRRRPAIPTATLSGSSRTGRRWPLLVKDVDQIEGEESRQVLQGAVEVRLRGLACSIAADDAPSRDRPGSERGRSGLQWCGWVRHEGPSISAAPPRTLMPAARPRPGARRSCRTSDPTRGSRPQRRLWRSSPRQTRYLDSARATGVARSAQRPPSVHRPARASSPGTRNR